MTVYAATKAGLKSIAEGIRIDMLNKPIKVTTVFPGFIESEMTSAIEKRPPFMINLDKGLVGRFASSPSEAKMSNTAALLGHFYHQN